MPVSFGFLSTFPPTQCGLATFTRSLAAHVGQAAEVGIVRVVDQVEPEPCAEVVHQWATGVPGADLTAAAALGRFDVAVVQHEYGIYAGADGDSVIGLLRQLRVPAIVVLHTVLSEPTPHQRTVLEEVAGLAAAVVVMTKTAERRLLMGYRVDPDRVTVIPHGAPTEWAAGVAPRRREGRPTILTWGLLGPGKGIEWAIAAVAALGDLSPAPRYIIAGETHPRVLERQGDRYRDRLRAQAEELGISHRVIFDGRYLDQPALLQLVSEADVVVLPYDSLDQVTSGVLIEAVTCGRPVVATAFPHAVELLAGGGSVVPHGDVPALAASLRRILTDPAVSDSMVRAATRIAPDLTWNAVADQYRILGERLAVEAVSEVA